VRQLAREPDRDGRPARRPRGTPDRHEPPTARIELGQGERVVRRQALGQGGPGVGERGQIGRRRGQGDHRLDDRSRDVGGARVGGEHVDDAELPEATLGLLIVGRYEADHRDPSDAQPGEGVAVQASQVGRQQDRAGLARRGRGEQVGEVHAPPYDSDPEVAALQGGDQFGLPSGVADRCQHRDERHRVEPASCGGTRCCCRGTRTRSTRPWAIAWTSASTCPGPTESTTG